jgi:hypothetical protein
MRIAGWGAIEGPGESAGIRSNLCERGPGKTQEFAPAPAWRRRSTVGRWNSIRLFGFLEVEGRQIHLSAGHDVNGQNVLARR